LLGGQTVAYGESPLRRRPTPGGMYPPERVKDIDFGQHQMAVRDGKGGRDRITLLPDRLVEPFRAHLEKVLAAQAAQFKFVVRGLQFGVAVRGQSKNCLKLLRNSYSDPELHEFLPKTWKSKNWTKRIDAFRERLETEDRFMEEIIENLHLKDQFRE
jgi:integrase